MITQDERIDPVIKAKVFSTDIVVWDESQNDESNPANRRMCIKCKCGRKVFKVDIPKAFFNEDGDFIARPKYEKQEILHVKWTGYGRFYGFIDTNVRGRGRGGEGGDGGDCAKWS